MYKLNSLEANHEVLYQNVERNYNKKLQTKYKIRQFM
jgi:hypothetical protein